MAEYIDREDLLKRLPDDLPYKASVKRVLMQPLAADVVPREKVARLRHILNSYALQYGTVKDQREVIDRIKKETAREISEDIIERVWDAYKNSESETTVLLVALICEGINAEIKKKYTEDGK